MLQLCLCRDIEHLGRLESIQEARVLQQLIFLYATFVTLSCTPNFPRAQLFFNTFKSTFILCEDFV